MKKKLLAIGLGAALSFTAVSVMAGNLSLTSVNEPNQINVKCGPTQGTEKDTGLPIPANGTRTLPYIIIKAVLGSPLVCDFYESGSNIDIATASLTINSSSSATITAYTPYHPHKFTVALSTPPGTPAANISVTLTKN
jgi:hypothetical protein